MLRPLKEEAKSTPIAKFKANLEARFYTALAKQITDNVFGCRWCSTRFRYIYCRKW